MVTEEIREAFNNYLDTVEKIVSDNIRFKQALEEIKEIAEKSIKISYNLEVNSMLYDIIHKINEVLKK